MIVLDSDLLVVDLRYPADPRYLLNRKVLDALYLSPTSLAITCQTLLEVIGVVSFNNQPAWTAQLPQKIRVWYGVQVLPSPQSHPIHSGCAVQSLVDVMVGKCSLGDAIQLEQMRQFAPQAKLFLSWNPRHFLGKLSIPVLTPEEWWQQNQSAP